jgi:hypothetical protein
VRSSDCAFGWKGFCALYDSERKTVDSIEWQMTDERFKVLQYPFVTADRFLGSIFEEILPCRLLERACRARATLANLIGLIASHGGHVVAATVWLLTTR